MPVHVTLFGDKEVLEEKHKPLLSGHSLSRELSQEEKEKTSQKL